MGQRFVCDMCDQPIPDRERVVVTPPMDYLGYYDFCATCWDEHVEPTLKKVAKRRPKRLERDGSDG